MEKSIFEQIGGTYHKQGDYILPDLAVPENDMPSIGVWGQRHLRYIREHRRGLYVGLQLSDRLDSYLADIDQQAGHDVKRCVSEIRQSQGWRWGNCAGGGLEPLITARPDGQGGMRALA